MNKICKTALCVSSAFLMIFGCACGGCNDTVEEEKKENYEQPYTGIHEGTAVKDESGKYFSGAASDYTIVIPDDATSPETTAAIELEYFLRLSTEFSLPTVAESQFDGGKYFSIGTTKLLSRSGIEYDEEQLGVSGFRLISDDSNNVYFIGTENGYGSLYAVYDFLSYTVGYKYYAADEYSVEKLQEVSAYDFDLLEVPVIQKRGIQTYTMNADHDNAIRLRMNGMGTPAYTGVHTEFQIMPRDNFSSVHPEWLSNDGQHLCYSADGLLEEFTNSVKQTLITKNTADYVTFGLADVNSFCGCDKCLAAKAKYGTDSAVMLVFVNKAVKILNEWLAETYPGREVDFLLLAYQKTVEAPVTENADGTLTPNDPELVCEDNLGIYIADAAVDYSKRLDSARNLPRYTLLKKWATLSKRLYIYTYAANFYYFPCSFPNYLAFEDNYTLWRAANVQCVEETGNHNCTSLTLDALRNFLMSKFMWNSGLNYFETVNDFMQNYYKEAGDAMYDYFIKLSGWQQYLNDTGEGDYGYLYYAFSEVEWPRYLLDNLNVSIQNAYSAIEGLKTTDPAMYEKLFLRIKTEELSIVYMYMSMHSGVFTRDEKVAMIDDFEYYCGKLGVTHELESSKTMQDTIDGWRAAL